MKDDDHHALHNEVKPLKVTAEKAVQSAVWKHIDGKLGKVLQETDVKTSLFKNRRTSQRVD